MFAFLRGTVAHKGIDLVHLDVNGVGYAVHVPGPVQARLQVGRDAQLITYCHIREESFTIYGFLREEEKTLFLTLLGVSGIGPKVALSVLSAMSPSEFGRAILENDVTAFTKIGGVGKKTAQRIVVEMKAKMGQDADLEAILGEPRADEEAERDDVIAALMAMGCTLAEAKRAALKARNSLGAGASDEELVKAALQSLRRVS
jgi:Holliday junction DNA helicase RuvA